MVICPIRNYMKLKFIFSIVIVSLLGLAFLSQFNLASAQEGNVNPATAPITYFKFILSGKVTYKGFFLSWVKPANNVAITVVNSKTRQSFSTKTNAKGIYAISIDAGVYKVTPSDTIGTKFAPNFRVVNLDRDLMGINFLGNLSK